jgi:hypothetical protein
MTGSTITIDRFHEHVYDHVRNRTSFGMSCFGLVKGGSLRERMEITPRKDGDHEAIAAKMSDVILFDRRLEKKIKKTFLES